VQEPPHKKTIGRWLTLLALIGVILGATAWVVFASGKPSEDPTTVLRQTFDEPHNYSSGVLDAAINLDGAGLTGDSGKLAITLKGPFSSNGKGTVPTFKMATGLGLGSRSVKIEFTSDGKAGWLGLAGLNYKLPDTVWSAFSKSYLGDGSKSSSSLLDRVGFRPQDWLKDPETIGYEDIGGTETVHVRAGVDGGKLVGDFGSLLGAAGAVGGGLVDVPTITAAVQKKITDAVKKAEINVWSGKADHALRKIEVTVEVGAVDGQRPTSLVFMATITELNQPQTIETPKSARPFDELSALIGAVTGVVTKGANGVGKAAKSFETCVAAAKNLDEAKKCSKELTK